MHATLACIVWPVVLARRDFICAHDVDICCVSADPFFLRACIAYFARLQWPYFHVPAAVYFIFF